ncbi:hypothetical protein [Helicobacter heilmannii]|uniref:Uncharacterized protein n=1 Tax=Helicobacter heilmannii TaxID=35817 RepID=A0A0K2XQL4_HELHE|nr:hypothetical protein [Helicobacter heilmannii]CCM11878.1 hypothetical protein BN341_2360 [Helicobacter heilmannii ASB1.4]CRF46391.1 hypothetical protein HHE014_13970 [Helicobacter heilmannii]CRF47130.1 hypothetical protein HHE02_04170 [Helicobacter heilmannii]CRF49565.1 hypothetical protein HHE03_11890 [Helicobacter heilmannii]CRF50737.1 hypothetical protein HHE06_05820 [Helicobacter heilmannii]
MQTQIEEISKVKKWIIKWKTRSLGKRLNIYILILSVLLFSDRCNLQAQLEKVKDYLEGIVNGCSVAWVFDRICVNVADYATDEHLYLKDRMRVFELLVQNIQLYQIVLDIWDDDMYQDQKDILKIAVQNAYDKRYSLDAESQRALSYQMRLFKR